MEKHIEQKVKIVEKPEDAEKMFEKTLKAIRTTF